MLGEGRDEGAEGDSARVGEEARDFADAADILVAVRRRETEVAAEAVVAADVVSVEAVAENSLGEEESWRSFNSSTLMIRIDLLTLATRYSSSANAIVVLPAPDSPVNQTVQPLKAFLLPRPSTWPRSFRETLM